MEILKALLLVVLGCTAAWAVLGASLQQIYPDTSSPSPAGVPPPPAAATQNPAKDNPTSNVGTIPPAAPILEHLPFSTGPAPLHALGQEAGFEQGLPTGLLSSGEGFHAGRFRFHGGVTGTVSYDDN